MFRALVINDNEAEGYHCQLQDVDESQLPPGNVTVDIDYSTLNYKDALAISGKAPIIRSFPMVPGVDFAGTVSASDDATFAPGDKVILTGWGVGEHHWGGLAQRACVEAGWLVKQPDNLSARQAMIIGTAGFTAMLCINALEKQGITPASGSIVVSGASGGVGGVAVSLLARLGYQVSAVTGRPQERDYLLQLGAAEIIDRSELDKPGKPLQKARWAAAIDTVGSHTLANLCASVMHGGAVAACGNAQGMDFPASVAPFILRGITLTGVDSVTVPQAQRQHVWQQLAGLVDDALLESLSDECTLDEAVDRAHQLMAGEIRGRLVVKCR